MSRTAAASLLASLALVAGSVPARAESTLRLPYPASFGSIPAATYDTDHHRVGEAHLIVERLEHGLVRLFSESGIAGGARTIASAELEPLPGGNALRPLRQESRSFDANGQPLGILAIDHASGSASCSGGSNGSKEIKTIELPERDSIANVPLNLFFQPLVRRETDELSFQLFFCRGGPRLMDFEARRVERNGSGGENAPIEVRYAPDVGGVLSFVAARLVPRLSFWFDPKSPHQWMGHRIPLYGKGPEVFVVREGVPILWLDETP